MAHRIDSPKTLAMSDETVVAIAWTAGAVFTVILIVTASPAFLGAALGCFAGAGFPRKWLELLATA